MGDVLVLTSTGSAKLKGIAGRCRMLPELTISHESARAATQVLYSLLRRLEFLNILLRRGADSTAVRSDVRDLAHME